MEKKLNVFSTEFDMKRYIEDRMTDILDLDERIAYKDLFTCVFSELYNYTQNEYMDLENKLQKEKDYTQENFTIYMGMVNKNKYDITDDFMYPMQVDDLNGVEIDSAQLRSAMDMGQSSFLYSVYLRTDYEKIYNLLQEKRYFKAILHTTEGEFLGKIYLKGTDRYDVALKELYTYFLINDLPWRTLNTVYLHKMVDVYLEYAEIPEDAQVKRVTIDFEEYTKYILYDYIPVWNINEVQIKVDMRPVPCIDKTHYKYYLNQNRLHSNSKYLVAEKDVHILDIQTDGDLIITCLEPNHTKWRLLELKQTSDIKYREPFFQNICTSNDQKLMRTQADIMHYIKSLGYESSVVLDKLEIVQGQSYMSKKMNIYDMNKFIDQDFIRGKAVNKLILTFQVKDKESIFITDIISYLVSALQRELPEYECISMMA